MDFYRDLEAVLVSGHGGTCVWRTEATAVHTDAPSAQPAHVLLARVEATASDLARRLPRLPAIDPAFVAITEEAYPHAAPLGPTLVSCFDAMVGNGTADGDGDGDGHTPLAAAKESALALALCGWKRDAATDALFCETCCRRVGTWNYVDVYGGEVGVGVPVCSFVCIF